MTLRPGDGVVCPILNTLVPRWDRYGRAIGATAKPPAPLLEAAPHSFDPWNTIGLGLRILVSLPCDPSLTLPKAESAFVMLCTRETTNSVQ